MAAADPYLEEIDRWRGRRRGRVAGTDGWLTVVGLEWLGQGSNTIGSDPSNRVRLPSGPPRLGSIEVEGTDSVLVSDDGTRTLRGDEDGLPTVVPAGSASVHVIRRDGRLAVRIKDPASRARAAFAGLRYFPVDPAWKVDARFAPYEPARSLQLPTVLDLSQIYPVPGALAFELDGRPFRLDAYEEAGEEDLFVIFGDRTNGASTFGGGRYLYVKRPGPDRRCEIDFNKAYNPPCAFTAFATCALAPPSNRLPVAVEAGELRYDGPPAT